MMNRTELNEEMLSQVNGGNWISDAWDSTCNWVNENKGIVVRGACLVGGIALCATGIGAAAGVGLIAVESVGAAAVVSTGIGGLIGTGVGAAVTDGWDD